MSPTQRTKKLLREEGWHVEITEKWNPHARIRQDLLGFGDLIAIKDDEVRLIQTTSNSGYADHLRKIIAEPRARLWAIMSGRSIELITWGKYVKVRGKKAKEWRCRRRMVTLKDFQKTT